MWAMPLPFLLSRFAALISLAIPATGLWLVWGFLRDPAEGKTWIVIGVVLLGVGLFGRLVARSTLRRPAPARGETPGADYDNVTGSGGADIAMECVGAKRSPLLVLTHGWGASREVWREVLPILARRFRVVMWDLAGHGESGSPYDGHLSVARAAQDLRAMLQLFPDRNVVLVSHSTGAQAVLSLLRDRPELMERQVAGAVLLNGAGLSPPDSGDDARLASMIRPPLETAARLGVWFSWLFRLGAWAGWLNGSTLLTALSFGFGPDPDRRDVGLVCRWAVKTRADTLARGMRALLEWDGRGAMSKVSVPILSVCGTSDLFASCETVEKIAKQAPFGEALRMENAGHFGPLGQPEAYAAAITLHAERAFAIAEHMKRPAPLLPPRQELARSWRDEQEPDDFDDPDHRKTRFRGHA